MWLMASDLHLTDNPRDSYRMGIFDWLGEQAAQYKATDIIILGDITDRKDHHSGRLLNEIFESVRRLCHTADWNVLILQGNHDYSDPLNAPFKILRSVGANWYDKPTRAHLGDIPVLFFPFFRDPKEFATEFKKFSGQDHKAIFFHQTFSGSLASSGLRLEGIPTSMLIDSSVPIFAGDIHVPQMVGAVEYVGSPYQITFGDNFVGRCLLFDPKTGVRKDLHYPTLRKWTIDLGPGVIGDASIKTLSGPEAGDQVKIRLKLSREEAEGWREAIRWTETECAKKQLNLFGIEVREVGAQVTVGESAAVETPVTGDTMREFCKASDITDEQEDFGRGFIGDGSGSKFFSEEAVG